MEGSKKFLFLFVLIIELNYANCKPYLLVNDTGKFPENIEFDEISNTKRVVNGMNSNENEFPWMAALVYEYPNGESIVKFSSFRNQVGSNGSM